MKKYTIEIDEQVDRLIHEMYEKEKAQTDHICLYDNYQEFLSEQLMAYAHESLGLVVHLN